MLSKLASENKETLSKCFRYGIMNLCFSGASCSTPTTHPATRCSVIIDHICGLFANGCDVVAIQEGRNCDNAPTVSALLQMLPDNIGHICVSYEETESRYSFFLITLYNKNTVNHKWSTKTYFEGHVKNDRSFLTSTFRLIGTDADITFVNTHFSMVEEEKDAAVGHLARVFSQMQRVIIVGDFNLFMDMRGPQQLEALQAAFPHRMGNNITLGDGTTIQGSFVGYPFDRQRKTSIETVSALLNGFCSADMISQNVSSRAVTQEVLARWFAWNAGASEEKCVYPSDHIFLQCEVMFG